MGGTMYRMNPRIRIAILITLFAAAAAAQGLTPLRPPAVPLVAHDPYFSIWSLTDRLTDSATSHWTGKPNSLNALVRIDGKTFRVMGRDRQPLPALGQTRL